MVIDMTHKMSPLPHPTLASRWGTPQKSTRRQLPNRSSASTSRTGRTRSNGNDSNSTSSRRSSSNWPIKFISKSSNRGRTIPGDRVIWGPRWMGCLSILEMIASGRKRARLSVMVEMEMIGEWGLVRVTQAPQTRLPDPLAIRDIPSSTAPPVTWATPTPWWVVTSFN